MSSPSPESECAQQDAVYKRAESQQRVAAATAVGSRRRHRLSQFKVAAKTVATDLLSCRAACFELLSRQLEAQPQARAQRDSGTAGQAAQLDSWTRGLNSTQLSSTELDRTELN